MPNRLYRSRTDRILGGVCGGLGAYFGVDPIIFRLVFVIFAIYGLGVLAYLVLWIVMPPEERAGIRSQDVIHDNVDEIGQRAQSLASDVRGMFSGEAGAPTPPLSSASGPAPRDRTLLLAGGLILVGLLFLAETLTGLDIGQMWPLILVAFGLYLVYQASARR